MYSGALLIFKLHFQLVNTAALTLNNIVEVVESFAVDGKHFVIFFDVFVVQIYDKKYNCQVKFLIARLAVFFAFVFRKLYFCGVKYSANHDKES